MFFYARLHCTHPDQPGVPNVYGLRLTPKLIQELRAYKNAARYVETAAKKFGGRVSGITFEFPGYFLDVDELTLASIGLTYGTQVEWLLSEVDLTERFEESDEADRREVTAWPEGSLFFNCLLDNLGFSMFTRAVVFSELEKQYNDRRL